MTNENKHISKECTQCGSCCVEGGPALHVSDLVLFGTNGVLDTSDLVTIRAGERAMDQPTDTIVALEQEMIKIRGIASTWTCRFFNREGNLCRIYDNRPQECQAYSCKDNSELEKIYHVDRITRRHLLPEGHPVFELIDEHDRRCSPARAEDICSACINDGDRSGLEELEEMLEYDRTLRMMVSDKGGISEDQLDFLFGRPLDILLRGLGVRVLRTARGIDLKVID